MKDFTPVQTLSKVHRELWWMIRLLQSVEVQFEEKSAVRIDVEEVEKVLREVLYEVGRIIRSETHKAENPGNIRQAEDFALKAQLAKVRSAVASVLKERADEQSDIPRPCDKPTSTSGRGLR